MDTLSNTDTHALAEDTLHQVANALGVSYHVAFLLFVYDHDTSITEKFWELINSTPKNSGLYNRFAYCDDCKSFVLYHREG